MAVSALLTVIAIIGIVVSVRGTPSEATQQGMSVDDILAIREIASPRFAPDGSTVVYEVREVDADENTETADLWRIASTGGEPARLTYQPADDEHPGWSPDGQIIAFLSDRPSEGVDGEPVEDRTQIWLLRAAGGEARQLTRSPTPVTDFDWSPDGRQLVFVAKALPDDHEEREERRRQGFDQIVADEYRMSHLWVVDVESGRTEPLTSGDFHATEPVWSPTGDAVAFVSRPSPNANVALLSDLYLVDPDGGSPRLVVDNEGPDYAPVWAPDGQSLAYLSSDRRQSSGAHRLIRVVSATGGSPRTLTSEFGFSAGSPQWSPDGETIYFATGIRTESHIFAVPSSGGDVRQLSRGVALHDALDVTEDGRRMLFLREDFEAPEDLWVAKIDGDDAERLTELNPQLSEIALAESEVTSWKGAEGWDIEGILVRPLGSSSSAGQPAPLVVEAHGGPHGRQTVGFDPMWQYFAAHGFMVLAPNFRGSGGYSQEFVDSDRNDWGGGDYVDIMNGVDHLIDAGRADPDRLGIEGWSYGGYMTSWIIGHTDRFKAAIVGAGVTNLWSFYGTTDIQRFIEWEYLGYPWDNLESIREHSPIFYAHQATIPTLILHGAEDVRVPIEQAWQLYTVLKKVGVTVEFVRYPREGHGLQEPNHRRDRYERSLAWFERFLGKE